MVMVATTGAVDVSVGWGANRWPDERVAKPFVYHADFSLEGHDTLFGEMTQLQRDLIHTLGVGQTREPIHIYLFGQKSTYQRYLKKHFPNVPFRRALFIKGAGPGMVFAYRSRDFDVDLRHECTHALLHASLPMVPLWLDEGLAEYFEVLPADRVYGNPHLATLKWNLRLGSFARITDLEAVGGIEHMDRGDYRHSWGWVHFMLHGPPEASDELGRFLRDLHSRTPPGHLSERLRARVPDLEQRFVTHFRTLRR